MKVITAAGETFDLGETEASPTVSIVDYSRRVTDDFGVTTVVERDFARQMSVRLAVPSDQVDTLQQRLIALRATTARWVADDRYGALSFEGFYKDFSIDLPAGALCYCTLTVEGLAEPTPPADLAADPAPDGQRSTLRVLVPTDIAPARLVASNVPEADYPAWAAGSYAADARVVRDHRVWESLVANNADDPLALSGRWLEVGPTNRFAMFDQALGTATSRAGSIVVTVEPGQADAVALLDVIATSARVQAAGYDRTIAVAKGMAIFADMPSGSGQVTVTITGGADAAVGTLLVGRMTTLGITAASPTAEITDFSRKERDDFGAVTIVERAWSKRMSAGALIRTDAINSVMNRVAAVRARPSLWIADDATSALTIYGFFKDFSATVGPVVSRVSLSVEGLSRAAPLATPISDRIDRGPFVPGTPLNPGNIVTLPDGSAWRWVGQGTHPVGPPLAGSFEWEAVVAPPAVIPPTTIIGGEFDPDTGVVAPGVPAKELVEDQRAAALAQLRAAANAELARIRQRGLLFPGSAGESTAVLIKREETTRKSEDEAFAETIELIGAKTEDGAAFVFASTAVFAEEDESGATTYTSLTGRVGEHQAKIEDVRQVLASDEGGFARAIFQLDVDGRVVGQTTTNTGETSSMVFVIDTFSIETPLGVPLLYADATDGGRVKMHSVEVDTLKVDTIVGPEMAQGSVIKPAWAILTSNYTVPRGQTHSVLTREIVKEDKDSVLRILASLSLESPDDLQCFVTIQVDGMVMVQQRINLILDTQTSQAAAPLSPLAVVSGIAAGGRTITVRVHNVEVDNVPLTVGAGSTVEVIEYRKAAVGLIDGSGGALPPAGSGGQGTGPGGKYDGNYYLENEP